MLSPLSSTSRARSLQCKPMQYTIILPIVQMANRTKVHNIIKIWEFSCSHSHWKKIQGLAEKWRGKKCIGFVCFLASFNADIFFLRKMSGEKNWRQSLNCFGTCDHKNSNIPCNSPYAKNIQDPDIKCTNNRFFLPRTGRRAFCKCIT